MKQHQLRGIDALIPFLQELDRYKILYRLDRERDDSIMIVIRILSKIIEVDFFQDHIEYSYYSGDESVHDDQKWLYETLEDFVRE